MKKFTFSFLLTVFLSLSVLADNVPTDMARTVAKNVYYQHTGIKQADIMLSEPFVISNENTALYYVFNIENYKGFVIVAADDRVVPVLGFSDEGNYSEENQPVQFVEWMQGYAGQIDYAIDNDLQSTSEIFAKWQQYNCLPEDFTFEKSGKDVSPLLGTIAWDQDAGWNNECPVDAAGPGGHVYAGCVATAAGQVMMYWQYPEQGTGSHSYYHVDYGTLSADFGATTYNWAGMSPTTYAGDCPLLQFHLGVAYEMDYGPAGSGASSSDVEYVLPTYFGYKNTLDWVYKSAYSTTDWENLLIAELEANRPMTYRGNNSAGEGGHAFVMDGVSGTDYFHFNWGWSGYNNGYYYLTNLNPGYDFTYDQAGCIGIEPNEILYPPTNLQASVSENDVTLTWEAPGESVEYIYDDDSAETGWTINPGYVAWLGNKFPVTDAGILTSIDLYGYNNPSGGSETVTIDIYNSSQNFIGSSSSFTIPSDAWITVPLPDISFNGNFYVMVKWDNLAGSTHYIGFDTDGTHATDNLDYLYDGTTWSVLHVAAGGDPGVFLIRATATVSSKGTVVYTPENSNNNFSQTIDVSNILKQCDEVAKPTASNPNSKALTGYIVFRDNSDISGTLSSGTLTYIDYDLPNGDYTYCIKAVYDSGTSVCSNEEDVTVNYVGINEINNIVKIYPNPTIGELNIDFGQTQQYIIEINDITGKTVFTDFGNSSNINCNVSLLSKGIYILNIKLTDKIITEKIIIE